jgi:dihydroneopterin aldolase
VNGRIALSGLRARGFHGVFDFEREQGQDFVVDVLLELDLAEAAASDAVADTVHYGELAERLVGVIAGEPVNLIETLADRQPRRPVPAPSVGRPAARRERGAGLRHL